eukprot:TRINITY_DN3972_c0_g1_i1.p1 TRINITY_DN3972_c0_g1~~TRINITY_DN3972_c0_g1_i1.p1  ORF type:complete len:1265 (-),score=322.50 TRINITY_DN3972_c0_g1_i1:137-3823(-)
MDSMMSGLVAGALSGYFEVFFKNFKKEDFKLNLSGSETSTTLHNLEIREDVVQEALGMPNFGVQRVFIDKLALKLKPTQLKSSPMRIEIDTVDVVLSEPWDKLPPLPKVIEKFMQDHLPDKGKPGSYGFVEQMIDGLRIDVRQVKVSVDTVGKYKVAEKGAWTPPKAELLVKNIALYTTNSRWEVVDLKKAREFNDNRPEIYVFKELTVGSINATIADGDKNVPILVNTKAVARLTIVKALDNQIKGISVNAELPELTATLVFESMGSLAAVSEGIAACMSRPDTPKPAPVECPHLTMITTISVPALKVQLLEKEGGDGVQVDGEDLEFCIAWPQNFPVNEKTISLYAGKLFVREFSAVNGPSEHPLLGPSPQDRGKDPFKVIPPLPKSLHPEYQSLAKEPALYYMKGLIRAPPEPPKFDQELQAVLNPLEIVVRPESVVTLMKLAHAVLPHAKAIAERRGIKPPGDLSNVMVCDPKEPYEQLISLKMEFSRISLIVPAPIGAAYNDLSINLTDGKLMSHPNIPKNNIWRQGICGSPEFPNSATDVSSTRESLLEGAAQLTKYKITSKVEIAMKTVPDAPAQPILTIPKVNVDLTAVIGKDENGKGHILLNEGSMHVKEIGGRLTQVQYKTMVKRLDELIPLIPMIITLSQSTTNVEVPKSNLLFFVKIDQGECSLCNDYRELEEKGDSGEDIEMLARMKFTGLQLCFENMEPRKLAKVALDKLEITAVRDGETKSALYNPNAFISCGSESDPLLLLRVEHCGVDAPLGEDGKAVPLNLEHRNRLALRINGFRCGANPNPAAKICYFFLDTERNFNDLLRTAKRTKTVLQDVDFKKVGALAKSRLEAMDLRPPDVDIDVVIDDTKIHLLRDYVPGEPHGNIAFQFKKLKVDRSADAPDTTHVTVDVEDLALLCNKEAEDGVTAAFTFDPLSFHMRTDRHINPSTGKWEVSTKGNMNQLNVDVNPQHNDVFLTVIHGVKKKNLQKIFDGLSKFMERKPGDDDVGISLSLTDGGTTGSTSGGGGTSAGADALRQELRKLSTAIGRAEEDVVAARTEKQRLTTSLQQIEQETGKSNVLATATRAGNLSVLLPNQTWGKRFFVLSGNELSQFEDQTAAKLVAKITVAKDTRLEVVNNVPNCFQISNEHRFIIAAGNDKNMSGWTNELLRVQAGKGASCTLERVHAQVARAKQAIESLANASDLGDRAALIARIRELEQTVAERDAKIKALSK